MSYKLWKGNVAASDVSSGTLDDGRVAASNVTQYETQLEGVLDINQLQVTGVLDMGSYAVQSTHTASNAADLINKQYFDDNVTASTHWKAAVEEQSNTAPGTPSDGDRVLVGAAGSGDFAGEDNKIATYSSGSASWSFEGATEGWAVYVLGGSSNADSILIFNGSTWVVMSNASGALIKTNNLSDLTSAGTARANLGLGSLSTQSSVDLTADVGTSVLPVASGGTGSSSAPMISVVTSADASASRSALGLGTVATQSAASITITGGSITGITDLAIADGGTGSSTASGARSNLGLGSAAEVDTASANTDSGKIPTLGTVSSSVAAVTVNASGAIVDASLSTSDVSGLGTAALLDEASAYDDSGKVAALGTVASGAAAVTVSATGKIVTASISSSDVSGLGTAATADLASSPTDNGKIPALASGISGGDIACKVGSSGTLEGVSSFTVSNISDAGDAASKNVVGSLSLTSGRIFVADSSTTFSAGDLLKVKSDGTLEGGSAGGTGTVTSITPEADNGAGTAITSSGNIKVAGTAPISTSISGTDITVSADDATTTAKGVASFSSDNFSVTGGEVTIKAAGVDLTAEVTGVLPVANGGSGSSTAPMVSVITSANAAASRTALGLGTASVEDVATSSTTADKLLVAGSTDLVAGRAVTVDGSGNLANGAIKIDTDGVISGAPSSFPASVSSLKGMYLYDLSGETSTSSITLPTTSNLTDIGYEVSIGVCGTMSATNALTISGGTYAVTGGTATAQIDDVDSITLNSDMQVLTIISVRQASTSDSNGSKHLTWKIK